MSIYETSAETKAKIILDEANLTFCETAERKDKPGARTLDGSCWDSGKMDGEYDERDFHRILELQLQAARICDERPELEEKTAQLFQKVTAENSGDILKEALSDSGVLELGKISVVIFLLRFPTVQSFVNKGHPLVLATDEYMLENANKQNWHDYSNIARDMGWSS
ncbi:MAG: hypothetical protein HY580_03725 [Nitrospinae bacterium]|nr:hypothetical protein [Nitrospinota bacterium]